jgi:hypothetical protein
MKNARILLAAFVVVGAVAAPIAAEAQWRNNGRYDRQWNRVPRTSSIRALVDRAERESNSFRADFERTYDRRDLNRYGRGDDARRAIQRLDESFERLRSEVDDRNPRRGRDEAQAVVRYAREVERLFDRNRGFHSTVRGDWNRLRASINLIARYYDLPAVR